MPVLLAWTRVDGVAGSGFNDLPPGLPSKAMPSMMCKVWPRRWKCQSERERARTAQGLGGPGRPCCPVWIRSIHKSPVKVSAGPLVVGGGGKISMVSGFSWWPCVQRLVGLFLSDLLELGDRAHGVRPARAKREVGDGVHELVPGQAVSQRPLQVRAELVSAVQRDQGRNRDQAAVALGQPGICLHVPEEHLVSKPHQVGGGVSKQAGTGSARCLAPLEPSNWRVIRMRRRLR